MVVSSPVAVAVVVEVVSGATVSAEENHWVVDVVVGFVVKVVLGSSVVTVDVSEAEEVVLPAAGMEVILLVGSVVDVANVVDTVPVDV